MAATFLEHYRCVMRVMIPRCIGYLRDQNAAGGRSRRHTILFLARASIAACKHGPVPPLGSLFISSSIASESGIGSYALGSISNLGGLWGSHMDALWSR
jgi:hypothetical protein